MEFMKTKVRHCIKLIPYVIFYVTNFSEETTEELLWRKFLLWGRLLGVFMAPSTVSGFSTNKHLNFATV